MPLPAIVTAGDLGAARAVYGESKVFLELDGRPLVGWVVAALQRVPEVSEVWVVGNAERLQAALDREELRAELRKPLHVVPQFGSLYENGWQTFRRALPGAGPAGRDPEDRDRDAQMLFLSGDLPFATPQEISQFVRGAIAGDSDYALGLVTEASMGDFDPVEEKPGIRLACFNLREGRFRQSNLHLIRPARIGNRTVIQEMYVHRHQREWGPAIALAWRLLRSQQGGLRVVAYYALMHLSGFAHRRGWPGLADRIRRWIPIARIERGLSSLLGAHFRFEVTEVGGCAVDIDTESEYDAARERFEEWSDAQRRRAERLHGPPELPAPASSWGRLGGTGP